MPPPAPNSRVRLTTVLAIFAAVAVIETIARVLEAGARGLPSQFQYALANGLLFWLLFGALSPIALRTARASPLERGRILRSLPAHAGALLLISLAHTIVYTTVKYRLGGSSMQTIALTIRGTAAANLRGDVFIYAVIVGAYYLYAHAERRRGR